MNVIRFAYTATLLVLLIGGCGDDSGSPDDTREDGGNQPEDASMTDAAGDGDGDGDGDGGGDGDGDAGTLPIVTANDCPEPDGEGTTHDSDVDDETWTAEDSPHKVTTSITIKGTVTVEACATVVLAEGVSIYVGSSTDEGRLITQGTYVEGSSPTTEELRPVVFTSASENEYWGMLFVNGLGEAEFNTTVLIRGGDAGAVSTSNGGSLVARGPNDGTLRRMVTANNLFIVDSGSFGVTLESGAGFVEGASSSLTVLNTGKLPKPAGYGADFDPIYPVFVEPPGIGTLPPGIYDGTTDAERADNDKILVVPSRAIAVDEQFNNYNTPYLIQGPFYMQPATTTTATLTIEPGVELRFYRDPEGDTRYGMTIGDAPASTDPRLVTLDIAGSANEPIVFTSDADAPAPGDWMGLYLDGSPASGNVLSHAVIEYAGGESGTNSYGCGPKDNDAAILITDWRPDDAFITDVTIKDSAAGGIVCGWDSDEDGPDFTGNTFENIANDCEVARWQNMTGLACPDRTDEAPLCL